MAVNQNLMKDLQIREILGIELIYGACAPVTSTPHAEEFIIEKNALETLGIKNSKASS